MRPINNIKAFYMDTETMGEYKIEVSMSVIIRSFLQIANHITALTPGLA